MKHFLSFVAAVGLSFAAAAQTYRIYPTPQEQLPAEGEATFTTSVTVVAEAGIDEATVQRALQVLRAHGLEAHVGSKAEKGLSCVMLGINGSRGTADKAAAKLRLNRKVFSKPKFDRHLLSLRADKGGHAQVVVLGEHTDAAFCGLASLEQILDDGTGDLPCVTLYDYADIRDRGIIEGYYGVPYSAAVTKDLFRFMARYKLNTYMYGAKSDPYHSQLWDEPYPTSITAEQERIGYLSQQMLRDITTVSHETKVNFIWAIHPGNAFIEPAPSRVIDRIMKKFEAMHSLGVRQFGVFVDDVGVPKGTDTLRLCADRLTELQSRIDARWNGPDATPADTVKALHYVPQLYAFSWVSREKGRQFFESLSSVPAKVRIYITGRNIWSVPNSRDLEIVKQWMGREASWWWNYPCNDNDVTKLFIADTYTNFRDEKHIDNLARLEPALAGTHTLILNPMQQGEASKIALFCAADYAWNNSAFDNEQSWEAALPAVVGEEYAPALRTAAPLLRYYDADALQYLVEDYKLPHPDFPGRLAAYLQEVHRACEKLEAMQFSPRESDRLFFEDIRPWVNRLKEMTDQTQAPQAPLPSPQGGKPQSGNLGKAEVSPLGGTEGGPGAALGASTFPILTGLGSDIKLSVKEAEPAAEVLRPFLEWLQENEKK